MAGEEGVPVSVACILADAKEVNRLSRFSRDASDCPVFFCSFKFFAKKPGGGDISRGRILPLAGLGQ